jgi:hypothetical protein
MAFTRSRDKDRIKGIKRLLGEAFVRSYQGKDNKSATEALDDAEQAIRLWNQDVSSKWYFCSALAASSSFVLLLILIRAPLFGFAPNDPLQLILTNSRIPGEHWRIRFGLRAASPTCPGRQYGSNDSHH